MSKNSRSIRYLGPYTSPGTPEYDHNNVGDIPKSWSSERVPLPMNNNSKRHVNTMPFNSAKTMPSKWDDAERWITSPIANDNSVKSPISQPQRRPKSKSGPLGPPGLVYASNYSPVTNSPFATGVLVPNGCLSVHYNAGVYVKSSDSLYGTNDTAQGTIVRDLLDSPRENSLPGFRDDKPYVAKEDESVISRAIYGKEMSAQMSPKGVTSSYSNERFSFSTSTSSVPVSSCPISIDQAAKDEIRDVQVDKGTTTNTQSKKQGLKKTNKDSTNDDDLLPLPWNASEASKSASKLQREEAKITAWENLQKAKAEAAIRKLEMKLEKKRSASMDRILNKLRAAQLKAQSMRNLMSEYCAPQARRRTISRVRFSCCIYANAYSPSSFSLCHRN